MRAHQVTVYVVYYSRATPPKQWHHDITAALRTPRFPRFPVPSLKLISSAFTPAGASRQTGSIDSPACTKAVLMVRREC